MQWTEIGAAAEGISDVSQSNQILLHSFSYSQLRCEARMRTYVVLCFDCLLELQYLDRYFKLFEFFWNMFFFSEGWQHNFRKWVTGTNTCRTLFLVQWFQAFSIIKFNAKTHQLYLNTSPTCLELFVNYNRRRTRNRAKKTTNFLFGLSHNQDKDKKQSMTCLAPCLLWLQDLVRIQSWILMGTWARGRTRLTFSLCCDGASTCIS